MFVNNQIIESPVSSSQEKQIEPITDLDQNIRSMINDSEVFSIHSLSSPQGSLPLTPNLSSSSSIPDDIGAETPPPPPPPPPPAGPVVEQDVKPNMMAVFGAGFGAIKLKKAVAVKEKTVEELVDEFANSTYHAEVAKNQAKQGKIIAINALGNVQTTLKNSLEGWKVSEATLQDLNDKLAKVEDKKSIEFHLLDYPRQLTDAEKKQFISWINKELNEKMRIKLPETKTIDAYQLIIEKVVAQLDMAIGKIDALQAADVKVAVVKQVNPLQFKLKSIQNESKRHIKVITDKEGVRGDILADSKRYLDEVNGTWGDEKKINEYHAAMKWLIENQKKVDNFDSDYEKVLVPESYKQLKILCAQLEKLTGKKSDKPQGSLEDYQWLVATAQSL